MSEGHTDGASREPIDDVASSPEATAGDETGAWVNTADGSTPTDAELRIERELLAEENRRLRDQYARLRRANDRRAALGLAAVGALALAGSALVPQGRTVLLALGATGLFAAVLTYYLSPERFITADVGERVYASAAANFDALVADLGLRETRVYVPVDREGSTDPDVRLFVPQHESYLLPDADTLSSLVVAPEDSRRRGVSFEPTGTDLYAAFTTTTDAVGSTPTVLAGQLADALVESFEIATSATPELDPAGDRLTIAISGSAYGAVDRFDHPIASFVATGLAKELGVPVETKVSRADDRADYLVTCRWDDDRATRDTTDE